MKKAAAIAVSIILLLGQASPVWAITGYEIGTAEMTPNKSNEFPYKELVFVSGGTPKTMSGTVKVASKAKNDTMQTTLSYKLTGSDKDSVTRSMKLDSTITKNGDQEVYATKLSNLTESVQVGANKMKLKKDGLFFSGSRVLDHHPMVDFYTENWSMKKTYEVGKNVYNIVVESNGTSEGYTNPWGAGATATITTHVTSYNGSDGAMAWEGSLETVTNTSTSRSLKYIQSQPSLISYAGGYLDESITEETSRTRYDMPAIVGTSVYNSVRSQNSTTMNMATPRTQKRLFIHEFKDIQGHWAQNQIEAMCGLGVFDNTGTFFGPGYAARREDLARGLAALGDYVQPAAVKTTAGRKAAVEEQIFADVGPDSPSYKQIQAVYKRGAMKGISDSLFGPYKELTRAQAVAVMTNTLGLNRFAPLTGKSVVFADDADIPAYARDSVYVAARIGLIKTEPGGVFRPNDTITRAELAVLLDNFRTYLNQDFLKDYREKTYTFK